MYGVHHLFYCRLKSVFKKVFFENAQDFKFGETYQTLLFWWEKWSLLLAIVDTEEENRKERSFEKFELIQPTMTTASLATAVSRKIRFIALT